MTPSTILLVDDHPIVREGYRRLLDRVPHFRVIAEAADAAEAYKRYRETRPDLTIMDLSMPGAGGIEAVRHIRQWDRTARILVVSIHTRPVFVQQAFAAGSLGYVSKASGPSELLAAAAEVARGRRWVGQDVARDLALGQLDQGESALADLSAREFTILRMLIAGSAVDEIAEALHLSPKTVRNHHYAIKAKLGARTDLGLALAAARAGIDGSDV
ncbi:response regulator [Chthonobacter rhizosphaerae]|uniref:response regulator n=1 Tax=Chthonobacter rhizosphaerae TaxID=2735553 RepID=UPI0015EE7F3F|nr:response regulator transcription factor [Chthonobacter rhizosphaerae]